MIGLDFRMLNCYSALNMTGSAAMALASCSERPIHLEARNAPVNLVGSSQIAMVR